MTEDKKKEKQEIDWERPGMDDALSLEAEARDDENYNQGRLELAQEIFDLIQNSDDSPLPAIQKLVGSEIREHGEKK